MSTEGARGMSNIEFVENLPNRGNRRRGPAPKYAYFADALKANPGHWAKWPDGDLTDEQARSRQNALRAGRISGFPRGQFEATVRQGVLYVRHVGGDQS